MNKKYKALSVILLKKARYLICIPFLIVFGLITLPLTLFFKWNGFWVLVVAHHEGCSLSKARKLFLENKEGKYTVVYENKPSLNTNNDIISINSVSSDYHSDLVSHPVYSSLPCNIHHRKA